MRRAFLDLSAAAAPVFDYEDEDADSGGSVQLGAAAVSEAAAPDPAAALDF